jgi:hypothetical protein
MNPADNASLRDMQVIMCLLIPHDAEGCIDQSHHQECHHTQSTLCVIRVSSVAAGLNSEAACDNGE